MSLGIDFRYGRSQPAEWETVLREVKTFDDALALMALFEHGRDEVVFANAVPVDAMVSDALLLSERGFADLLASHLHTVDGNHYEYADFYSPTRGRDAEQYVIDSLVERCRIAGVVLERRPQPPAPWTIAVGQIATLADARAFAAIHADDAWSANNWPVSMQDVDLVAAMPIAADGVAPTPDELADFVARCRAAGVILVRE